MDVVGRVESGGVSGGTLEMGGQRIERAYGDHVVVRTSDKTVTIWEEIAVTTTPVHKFELDADGWRVEVLPAAMIWAAPPVWRVLARTGDAGDHTLRAGGPESLFLVVGSPSAFFRRALRPPVLIAIAIYVALAIASTLV